MATYIVHQEQKLVVPRNPHDYIGIKGTRFMIEREQSHNSLDFNAADASLRQEGLFMPSPAIFMPYRNEVIKAAAGNARLYDGTGKKLTRESAQEIAGRLTKDCWSWLYASFTEDSKGLFHITYNRVKDAETIEEIAEKLQLPKRIKDRDLVDLAWNKQGMPVRKSKVQKFDANKNLFFYGPFDDSVARFWADACRADLDCNGGPQVSYGGLGTFACAAGAQNF